jgi:hypothetical protein
MMSMRTKIKSVASGLLTGVCITLLSLPAEAADWVNGDLFLAVSDGRYQVRAQDGTLKETLVDGLGGFTTGCGFNPSRDKLYTTNFSSTRVIVYDRVHPHTIVQNINAATVGGGQSESIVFDAVGNFYVGHAGGNVDIQKYNAAGVFQQAFNVVTTNRGSDWIDLAADQCTMYYTSEGTTIKRFDVCTNTQLTDFASGLHGAAFALRILADGGVLVADSSDIHRLNSAGAIVQTYDAPGADSWFALNLDSNGTSFWSGDINTASVYRFNINTGVIEAGPINTGTGGSTLFGICLLGETTVAIEGPPGSATCSDGIDNDRDGLIDLNDPDCQFADATPPSCTLTAVLPGPPTQIKVTTQDTGSGLASITPLISTNAVVTFSLTPGTTDPVVVTGTKIDQSKKAQVMLEVKDVAGNTTTCDPVLTLLVRENGKPVTETLTDIPDIESQITIANGSPGIKNLLVTVNGVAFRVNGLKDFEERSFDVSSAMHEGDNNTITLTAWGKPGSQATIIISE